MSEKLRKIGSELTILVGVIVFSLAARSVIVDHYYIPSESMEYSLLVGDRVLVLEVEGDPGIHGRQR